MKPVERGELLDYQTYQDRRDAFRAEVLAAKRPRRVEIAGVLTLLFENRLTVRYQIQEMMRAERLVREADIGHELDTYNELLGGPGELGATLLVEIEDPVERRDKLARWRALPEHLYALLADGTRVVARFDERQRDESKLSAVQFLKFAVRGQVPVALVVDLPDLHGETRLGDETRQALAADLAG